MTLRRTRLLFTLVLAMDLLVVMVALGAINVDPDVASASGRTRAKVAIIVGPVAGLTDEYRLMANEAASAARAMTDRVVTVYSPDATWPAARAALTDASIVVYLGHGNGWPSPYRDELYRRTQNGLGLNPVAGVDDEAHQYFGESYLSRVRLAPGAVVILGHLCYASGNPEPGGPEPTLDVARQRVDNYAAGWLAAGAVAVIAEGHGRPAPYVTTLLKGRGTIDRMWSTAKTAHDNIVEFPSARTPTARVKLDPDQPGSGYFRSLTIIPGARIADTLRSTPTVPDETDGPGPVASPTMDPRALAARGARFGVPALLGDPVADTAVPFLVPVDAKTMALLPEHVSIGTRWDRLPPETPTDAGGGSPDSAGSADATGSTEPTDVPSASGSIEPGSPAPSETAGQPLPSPDPATISTPHIEPAPQDLPDPQGTPDAASPDPATTALPSAEVDEPPTIDLIQAETPGKVVTADPSTRSAAGLELEVSTPPEPGLYRLVTTIHDADGVAYDAETQALVGALIVRVTGAVWASYGVPSVDAAKAGEDVTIRVRLANSGTLPWAMPWSERASLLVARWVALDDTETHGAKPGETTIIAASVAPSTSQVLDVSLRAPERPGHYLVVFDILDGDGRSLAAIGVPPGLARVEVLAPMPLADTLEAGS